MRSRNILVVASVAFVAFGMACVDLFHSTDFETLCTRTPSDLQCGSDAATLPDVIPDVAVDARKPHPDFCAWSSPEARQQALRACAWLGACEGPLGESALGPCVIRAQLAYDCTANSSLRPAGASADFWTCLAGVKTCDEVDECVFPSGVNRCASVATGSFTACGKGNETTRLRCARPEGGRASGVEPCAMLGQTCSKEDETSASCGGTSGFDCTTTHCAGTSAVDCNIAGARPFDNGVDCANVGSGACVPAEAGPPSCAPGKKASACDADHEPQCTGDTVTACIGGKELSINCRKLGLPCDVSGIVPPYDLGAACIQRAGQLCTSADGCTGATLHSCGRGAEYTVDCLSVGLGTCDSAKGRAACLSPP